MMLIPINNFLKDSSLKMLIAFMCVRGVHENLITFWLTIFQFDAPVVAAWSLFEGEMSTVDLFSGAQWTPSFDDALGPISPTLYIGMHKRQVILHIALFFIFEIIGKERAISYRKNEQISGQKAHTNTQKLNWNVSTITDVFLNQKRVNIDSS